jgi:sigma-E factor negative regulatory protein RseA
MDKISALMDGELDAHQSDQQYTRLKQDSDARACWNTYHLIGDALRRDSIVATDISAKLGARLEQEPTVLAPQRSQMRPVKRNTAYALSAAASLSAVALVGWMAFNNPLVPQPDSVATSVATSVPTSVATSVPTAVPASVGTPVATSVSTPTSAPVALSAPVAAVTPASVQPELASVPSDGKMNEYLMAHQEFSPSTAIQGVAPYIRSVSASK